MAGWAGWWAGSSAPPRQPPETKPAAPTLLCRPNRLSLQVPGLAVVLVGSRGDSETYVRSKVKACEEVGIQSFATYLPDDVSKDELLKARGVKEGGRSAVAGERKAICSAEQRDAPFMVSGRRFCHRHSWYAGVRQ